MIRVQNEKGVAARLTAALIFLITAPNTEIAGAKTIAETASRTAEATFRDNATATLPTPGCTSWADHLPEL